MPTFQETPLPSTEQLCTASTLSVSTGAARGKEEEDGEDGGEGREEEDNQKGKGKSRDEHLFIGTFVHTFFSQEQENWGVEEVDPTHFVP